MDNIIKIYKCSWNDISEIRKFLNEYLLKYRIYEVDENLFNDAKKDLPIVEIRDDLLYNPTVGDLKDTLGLRDAAKVNYVDTIVAGSSIECLFVLDYSLKHNINAVMFGKVSPKDIAFLQDTYANILKIPNPYIEEYIFDKKILSIEMLPNRMYIKVETEDEILYTRSIFVVFDGEYRYLSVENEDEFIGKKIFLEKTELIKRLKEKRVRNSRPRVFAIVGDHPHILSLVQKLDGELRAYSENMNYEIIVISSRDFQYENKHLLRALRIKQNIKIYGRTKITNIEKNGFMLHITTDLPNCDVDYILEYNKREVENSFMKNLVDFDVDGFLETDHTYKTKFINIYSMKKKEFDESSLSRIELLDRYIECAEVAQRLKKYLDTN